MIIYKIGAEWCSGCVVMKPRWQKVEQAYKHHGIELNTVFYDYDDSSDEVQQKLEELDIKPASSNTQVVLPVFIWQDSQGQEIARRKGEISEEEIMDLVDQLLKQEGIESPRAAVDEERAKRPWWKKLLGIT
jgi:thiol-disulfide isomerase/thioredoxin